MTKAPSGVETILDLLDTASFRHGHPHPTYDALRRTEPVSRHPGSEKQPPFWILTRYADIQFVSRDSTGLFSSKHGFRIPTDKRASMDPEIGRTLSRFMLAMDSPEHEKYRNVASSRFWPSAVRALEPRVNAAIADVFEGIKGRQEVDFVTDVAATVPIRTVCALLGVPPEDEQRVFDLTNSIFGTDDPEYAPTLDEANRRYLEVFDYAAWLLEQRRQDPRDDLTSVFAHATVDGRPLSLTEQKSFFSNMLGAGNETTRSSLAGAIWALSQHSHERDRLLAEPNLMGSAIHELLRYVSPVYHMARTATRDVELSDKKIASGERVAMMYGAGNRDPEVFEDPHRLDLSRANASSHLTFGIGIHHCLGSRLAGMQLRAILSTFLAAYPRFEVVAPPVYLASNFVAAIKSLPLRLYR